MYLVRSTILGITLALSWFCLNLPALGTYCHNLSHVFLNTALISLFIFLYIPLKKDPTKLQLSIPAKLRGKKMAKKTNKKHGACKLRFPPKKHKVTNTPFTATKLG